MVAPLERPRPRAPAPGAGLRFMLLDVHCCDYKDLPPVVSGDWESPEAYRGEPEAPAGPAAFESVVALTGVCLDSHGTVVVFLRGFRPRLESSCRVPGRASRVERGRRFRGFDPSRAPQEVHVTLFDGFGERARARKHVEEDLGGEVFWRNVDPATEVLLELGLTAGGTAEVVGARAVPPARRRTSAGLELLVDLAWPGVAVRGAPGDRRIPRLRVLSYDGEMRSWDGEFPKVLKGDTTWCVGTAVWDYPESAPRLAVHVVAPPGEPWADAACAPGPDLAAVELHRFHTPGELMEGLRAYVVRTDPDVLTGWNTYGFDNPFLIGEYLAARGPREGRVHHEWFRRVAEELGARLPPPPAIRSKAGDSSDLVSQADYVELAGPRAAVPPLETIGLGSVVEAARALAARGEVPAGVPHALERPDPPPSAFDPQLGLRWSRFLGVVCDAREKRMKSAAKGDQVYVTFGDCFGRVQVDLMQWIKDDMKPPENSLDYAARTLLKDELKDDLPKDQLIGTMRALGGPRPPGPDAPDFPTLVARARRVIAYCAQDAKVPARLVERLDLVSKWAGFCRVRATLPHRLLNSGQGRPSYNTIVWFLREDPTERWVLDDSPRSPGYTANWMVDDDDLYDDGELEAEFTSNARGRRPRYQGAIVIYPDVGLWFFVGSLDFASLYPNCMISGNLCSTTQVLTEAALAACRARGIEVRTYTIHHNVHVRDPSTGLPAIGVDGKYVYREIDRDYHFVARPADPDAHPELVGVTPRVVRKLLDERKKVKRAMKACKDPFERKQLDGLQLAYKLSCNSVYGFNGTLPRRSLLSNRAVAAVTTLIGREYLMFSKAFAEREYPGARVVYGDSVVGATPVRVKIAGGAQRVLAVEDLPGALRRAGVPLVTRVEPRTGKARVTRLGAAGAPLCEVWSDAGWTAVRAVVFHALPATKRLLQVWTSSGIVVCTSDHSLLDHDARELRPEDLRVGATRLLAHGYPPARRPDDPEAPKLWTEWFSSPVEAQERADECRRRGVPCVMAPWARGGVALRGDAGMAGLDEAVVGLEAHALPRLRDLQPGLVLQVRDVTDDYAPRTLVWDLTTDSHHFAAGVGDLVVHNTDSIMVHWPRSLAPDVASAWRVSIEAAQRISDALPEGLVLEPEEIKKILCLKPKRYAALVWENPDDPEETPHPLFKGISLARRDTSELVKQTVRQTLDLMLAGDWEGTEVPRDAAVRVCEPFRAVLERFRRGDVPLELVQSSRSVRSTYDRPESIPQWVAWDRSKRRGDPDVATAGTRVKFVYVDGPGPKSQRAETVEHVRRHGLRIDAKAYLESLVSPMEELLGPKILGAHGIDVKAEIRAAIRGRGSHDLRGLIGKRPTPAPAPTPKPAGGAARGGGARKGPAKPATAKQTSLKKLFQAS